jgi:hypothetical protein
MAPNMCYYRNADAIADVLNGEDGIELQDVLTGVIGLCRIVASQQAQINVLKKDLHRIAEDHRREIVTNTETIELLTTKLIAQGEVLRAIPQPFNNTSKKGKQ